MTDASKDKVTSVDAYVAGFSEKVQAILNEIRQAIREEAPGADETISYGMPTYKQQGVLVHFAAWEKHIGFYATPSGHEAFKNELAKYKQGKGSVQFPLDDSMPFDLIRRIVRFRLDSNLGKG